MDFTLREIFDPIDNEIELIFDFDSYNFFARLEFKWGTLYGWYGTVYYDCENKIICRTERSDLQLIYAALPIEDTVFKSFFKINKNTSEKQILFSIDPGGYNYIPNSIFQRNGLPAIGESL